MSSDPRQSLLTAAFLAMPKSIAGREMRPISPGSWALLAALENPLIVGSGEDPDPGNAKLFRAVAEFVWVHSAPIDDILAIEESDDLSLPLSAKREIGALSFELSLGEALDFMNSFGKVADRINAAMAEPVDDDTPGKRVAGVPGPGSSPPSSLPSDAPGIPSGSGTFSGILPTSAPSSISTPPDMPMAPPTDGYPPLMVLPAETP